MRARSRLSTPLLFYERGDTSSMTKIGLVEAHRQINSVAE